MVTEIDDRDIDDFIIMVFERYNYDFRSYARSSLRRRLATAMVKYGKPSISAMKERASVDVDFFLGLLQYLTVPTSEIFRDPQVFKTFRERAIPVLRTYPSLRFWIAGCSTGEELYSYAILLHEEGLLEKPTFYATDINPVSLKKAEQGFFPTDRMKLYSTNYQQSGGKTTLSDYFSVGYDSAMIDKSLRKNVVFADHSLATDSVFGEMQVVSCRNVMIYFNKELQDRALGLFHESLCFGGFLVIGSKETLRFSRWDHRFSEFSKPDRIYQRK